MSDVLSRLAPPPGSRHNVRRVGRGPGEFENLHNIAIDSKGNIYTTEVDTGKRAQKFRHVEPAAR